MKASTAIRRHGAVLFPFCSFVLDELAMGLRR